jgi:hypothetical protein
MGTGSFCFPLYGRQSLYTERCTSSLSQAAIRNSQHKLIYRYDYTTATLVQALYAVADLAEVTNLFGTGIADEVVLMDELHSMWASESDDPLTGCP